MNQFLSTLKSGSRAALVAVALGAASLAAVAPTSAMAQSSPSLRLDFGIQGGTNSFSFGLNDRGIRFRRDCLTNNEIRRGLRRAGFEDIRIGSSSGRWVRVVAEWSDNGRDYSMRVHRCTGEVTDIRRIRRGGGSPGFGFQFEFDF